MSMIFLDCRSRISPRSLACIAALFSALALAEASSALAAAKDDLKMSFSSSGARGQMENIIGSVTNVSNELRYPCVGANFQYPEIGPFAVQSIVIRDIAPGATVRFSAPMNRAYPVVTHTHYI